MRVYFVRHGESEENITDIYIGPTAKLTELGYEQARFVAERFTTIPVDLIIASTMERAKETARIISETIGVGVTHSDLLVETDAPETLLNKQFDDPDALKMRLEWFAIRFADEHEHMQYNGEESVGMLKTRAKKALDFLKSQNVDDILVVTHGTFLRVMLGIMFEGDDFSPRAFERSRRVLSLLNTGITVCEYTVPPMRNDNLEQNADGFITATSEPIWRIITLNDHAHLG